MLLALTSNMTRILLDYDDGRYSMTPQANNFDDRGPTEIDLVSPFAQDDLTTNLDPPTTFLQRARFQELPPGTLVGEIYEIGERLGAGSMGEIYAAVHMGLGKHVAIKVIHQHLSEDDRAIRRLITEAQTLAQIQHPAIVTVEHVGALPDGRAYFVMERLHGESLFDLLSRGWVPFHEALRILDQLAQGLAAAHNSGVIHHDLKPDNTFLVHRSGEKPAVKLLDFGLAKHHGAPTASTPRHDEADDEGYVWGTPLYMSPEQVRGLHLDHRSDIYALGCVAYELVLGALPFPQAQTVPAICTAHLHETPPLPRSIWPEIPPQLDCILFAMLAKDPANRPTLAQLRSVITDLRAAPVQLRSVITDLRSSLTQVRSVITDLRAPTPSQQTMRINPWLPKKTSLRSAITMLAAVCILAAGVMLGATVSSKVLARNSMPSQHIQGP